MFRGTGIHPGISQQERTGKTGEWTPLAFDHQEFSDAIGHTPQ